MENKQGEILEALLYSAEAPSPELTERFEKFLSKKYSQDYKLKWIKDENRGAEFKLKVGEEVFHWTNKNRLEQFREVLKNVGTKKPKDTVELISLMKSSIEGMTFDAVADGVGVVRTVGDGIVVVDGLPEVQYGEIVVFECGVKGMVQDLKPDSVGVILFGDDTDIVEGSHVKRTKKTAGIPVGDNFLGRVIDALGNPIDGKGEIHADGYNLVESPAPGIVERKSVDTPMNTGILSIDSMFPIGRGQRELIIGDRQTGKTAIAMDTILNQKGNGVICIYVAIGQKASSVAQLVGTLKAKGAMDYTIVINASASETAPIQYIAPYSGAAMGEYFMNKGKDVLIVYDDLSKHAIAYRALSLLLERSPGREAYPGDVFYLHSRLLERSARLNEEYGGGSMTALPIVETQAGDVSAYIPTNIISITDGQIFLESDMFHAGQRPAVNVGLSVSRVGGAAQTKAMKKAAGTIRLDLAQFREMEVFTQFSSDLDEQTKRQLNYGQGLMRLLRQPQGAPFSLHEQVIILVSATAHVMEDIPVDEILDFRTALLNYFNTEERHFCDTIETTGRLTDDQKAEICKIAKRFLKSYQDEKNAAKEAKKASQEEQ